MNWVTCNYVDNPFKKDVMEFSGGGILILWNVQVFLPWHKEEDTNVHTVLIAKNEDKCLVFYLE